MQKITTFLWFDKEAEDAANFYVSLFRNSRITTIARRDEAVAKATGQSPGSVLLVTFELDGQEFMALNGGPHHKLSNAMSLLVHCDDQAEVDRLWDTLCEGGQPNVCGWLTDKFGLSWQIVPKVHMEMMRDPNPKKSAAVMAAMMQMTKFDIATLKKAYDAAG
jgi:predicted 3-demethylubiquinone-9 3-methyltransferase (glyoxalase superfamily)